MKIEYEATFIDIKKDQVRQKLKELGATLKRAEFMQKRATFNLPRGHEINGGWLRVRDEGNKITLTLKVVDGNKIENQKEILLNVDSFEQAVSLLSTIGCSKKSFQESKRELWILDGTEITIDEWPFLEPYVEVEGKTEQAVKDASKKMGFDYSKALFCTVDTIYEMKYGVSKDVVNKTPEIKFNTKNPFSK
jgi:adenylate cyclase class 2